MIAPGAETKLLLFIVRLLKNKFKTNVNTTDKSTKLSPHMYLIFNIFNRIYLLLEKGLSIKAFKIIVTKEFLKMVYHKVVLSSMTIS